MKKLFIGLMLIFATISVAFANDATKIRVNISGATGDNRYFICSRDFGCLSILSGQRGRVIPIFRSVNVGSLFVMDRANRKLSPQGAPASCQGAVEANKTITITGHITPSANGGRVNGLRCSVS